MMKEMNAVEFEAYREHAVRHFAEELVIATGRTMHEALIDARALMIQLLPEGRETKGHRFFLLPGNVGYLWYARAHGSLFVYDLFVKKRYRGRGHGRTAMLWLEEEAAGLGEDRIVLSVFAHNEAAIALYESLDYEVIETGPDGQRMAKKLATAV